MLRHGVALGALVALVVTAFSIVGSSAGCEEADTPHACTQIPSGGCPRSHGVACQDPACEAVYLCRSNNVWELERRCPPIAVDASRSAGQADANESAPELDAAVDAPPGAFGGVGCDTLQAPECSLGLVLSCGTGCCGCEDVFVCQDRGWTLWGVCADGGVRQ